MSIHFAFLQTEWLELYTAVAKAETLANPDARTACFYARRTLELAVQCLSVCLPGITNGAQFPPRLSGPPLIHRPLSD
jgi:hypothetical protein